MRDSNRSAVRTKKVYFCSTTLFRKPEITRHSDRASKFSLNKRVIMLWLLLYWDFTRVWISFLITPLCHTCINLCKTLCQLYLMCVRMNDKGRSLLRLERVMLKRIFAFDMYMYIPLSKLQRNYRIRKQQSVTLWLNQWKMKNVFYKFWLTYWWGLSSSIYCAVMDSLFTIFNFHTTRIFLLMEFRNLLPNSIGYSLFQTNLIHRPVHSIFWHLNIPLLF